MPDLCGLMDGWMDDVFLAHAQWLTRCARVVDPRDITHLVRERRPGGDVEVVRLRGQIIGEWRIEYAPPRITARGLVYGEKPTA